MHLVKPDDDFIAPSMMAAFLDSLIGHRIEDMVRYSWDPPEQVVEEESLRYRGDAGRLQSGLQEFGLRLAGNGRAGPADEG